MQDHPIPSATDPFQYRAIGTVRGVYVPQDSKTFTRGSLIDANGEKIEAVVLGRVITLIRRHLSIDSPHLWVVYPRCRNEDTLHLQINGIWEPSTLSLKEDGNLCIDKSEEDSDEVNIDAIAEGDDYFSIRGELIYTKPDDNHLVLKVRQRKRSNGKKGIPFKLNIQGDIPRNYLRHFISLDVRRIGQKLHAESYKVIGPIPAKRVTVKK